MDGVRAPRRARLVAVAGLAAVCLAQPHAARAELQRGVAYTTYSANTYGAAASDASLARLAGDGNSHVAIVVTRYMANPYSIVVAPTASTPTDASILHAMQTAHAFGVSVTLKPQIDIRSGGWRGGIAPLDPSAWFNSYEATIDHYADLAREGGASLLVVGTEFKSMTGPLYTARWRQLIAGVRARFSGQLTYAANWDEFQRVGFWPSLDYIGVDAYWPVASSSDEPVSALVSAWTSRGYIASLGAVASRVGKPVLLTEVGYRSIVGATIHPGIWDSVGSYDPQEQANAYEAAYEALAGQPWFAGLYWWSWPAALPPDAENGDYTPTFKPAESVMKSWNASLAPAPVAADPVMSAPVAAAPGQPPVTPVPVKSNQKPAKPSLPVHSRPRAHHSKGHRTARHRPKGRR